MITVAVKVQSFVDRVEKAQDKAAFRNYKHAAASIRKDMAGSIEQAEGPSPAGTPPHTHRRRFLARAIRFFADEHGALIGPMHSIVGEAGAAHEFGGEYKGQTFDKREFAGPALERGTERFAGSWAGSVGA